MTKDAQFALRRVIERYTKSTRFALICNNVNKIIPALQSRCTRFRFAPLDAVHVNERLKHVITAEGLDVTEDGLKALVRLSNGDMRKALNILQSTHMASQQITEEAVYLCTGNPLPKDIEQISYWLLNEPFSSSFQQISDMKATKGLALVDIVREVTMFVFRIKMPSDVRVQLINDLADIEYRLTFGCNDKLQLGSVISTFTQARSALVAAAKLTFGCNDKLQLPRSVIFTFTQARNALVAAAKLTSENKMPHLLLYGPPGTGKTSTILAVARKLFGAQMHNMVLELNASDERGIDVVRQQIQDFASTQSFSFGAKASVKLVLLDEADAMTKDAQFALRRVIERYTKSTRFALICNNVNKIIPALQSRCTRFRFAPLDAVHVNERLKHVITAEGLDVTEDGLKALVRLSNGDMRKALNILQSTHMASQQITEEAVYLCTGNPLPKDIEQISYWLLNEPFSSSFQQISDMKATKGLALVDIVREVTMFVFRIKMPSDVRVQLINDLADIEYRLTFGCNDKLQLGSVISTFTQARSALVAAAK
ncbi:replication factor C subunit 3 [Artemisia annua]|uniref:Replication factor C subunit 3 n=1 Tax=Artemisia annua TaxID=35608 RepID=A0A2U1PWJ8_ARTAN|nr:replication factor C subunit 3 [Artemisia annua]